MNTREQGGHLEEKVASVSVPGDPEFEVAAGASIGSYLDHEGKTEPEITTHSEESPLKRKGVWSELGSRVTCPLQRVHSVREAQTLCHVRKHHSVTCL